MGEEQFRVTLKFANVNPQGKKPENYSRVQKLSKQPYYLERIKRTIAFNVLISFPHLNYSRDSKYLQQYY